MTRSNEVRPAPGTIQDIKHTSKLLRLIIIQNYNEVGHIDSEPAHQN